MVNWDRKNKKDESTPTKIDVSKIDQSVFDDPILLLEYLQGLEEDHRSVPSRTAIEKKHPPKAAVIHDSQYVKNSPEPKLLYGYAKINGKIIINQEQAEAISLIISLHEKGFSCSQIAYKLSSTKYRTVTGRKFYTSSIYTIIKNKKAYEGELGYPPIIQKDNLSSGQKTNIIRCKSEVENITHSEQSESQASSSYWKAINRLRNDIDQRKKNDGKKSEISGKKSSDSQASSSNWKAISRLRDDIDQRRKIDNKNGEISGNRVYINVEEFLSVIKSKGVPIKDNRSKDGCVWVRADIEIADIMAHAVIKGRGFRYSPKCKAFNGEPGWYY